MKQIMDTIGVAIVLLLYCLILANTFVSWYALYAEFSRASFAAYCITSMLAFVGTWVLFGDTT